MELATAVIVRKSTRDEAKVSVTRQEALGREWAQQNRPGHPVLVFTDEMTGARMDRPGWQEFVRAVQQGRVSHVWGYEQSRLTRAGTVAWDDVCELLWNAGIPEVHTQRQGIIRVVEGDRLHGFINAVMDRHEREVIKVRTRQALQANADDGRPHGRPGYGYQLVDGADRTEWEPDPHAAPIVARIVRERAEGSSFGLIARRLNDDQVPPPGRSTAWRPDSVRIICTAPRIIGYRTHRGKMIPATWPAIVDRATWERAQARFTTGHGRTADKRRRYLLTRGIAICDHCDTPLIAATAEVRGQRVPAYQCPHPSRGFGGCGHCSILATRLEDHVVETVGGWLRDPAWVQALNDHLRSEQVDTAPIRAELEQIEDRLARLAEAWASGTSDLLELEHAAARRTLLAQRDALMAQLPRHEPPRVNVDDLVAAWRDTDDLDLRREIIATVAKPIRVHRAFRDGRRLTVEERVRVLPRWA